MFPLVTDVAHGSQAPLRPAHGAEYATGDGPWLRRAHHRIGLGTLVAAASVGLWLPPRDVSRATGGEVDGEWQPQPVLCSAAYVLSLALIALLVVATTRPLLTAVLGCVVLAVYARLAVRQFGTPVAELVSAVRARVGLRRAEKVSA